MHIIDNLQIIKNLEVQLQMRLGRQPTDMELLEQIEQHGRIQTKRNFKNTYYLPTVQKSSLSSLDGPIAKDGDETDDSMYAILENRQAINPLDYVIQKDQRRLLNEFISTLDAKGQIIIKSLYGLDGNPCKTLQEIGDDLDLSTARVSQIAQRCLNTLRAKNKRSPKLKELR